MSDIWKDPGVKAALKDGRTPDDICVLNCPKCGKLGYYNQGSSFYCRRCRQGFYCCSEEESPPDKPHIYLDDMRTLADVTGEDDLP